MRTKAGPPVLPHYAAVSLQCRNLDGFAGMSDILRQAACERSLKAVEPEAPGQEAARVYIRGEVCMLFRLAMAMIAACALAAGTWAAGQSASGITSVKQAQTLLKDQGYYSGAIDGQYGPKMRHAIERFQRDHGLKPTGKMDSETAASLAGGQKTSASESSAEAAKKATGETKKAAGEAKKSAEKSAGEAQQESKKTVRTDEAGSVGGALGVAKEGAKEGAGETKGAGKEAGSEIKSVFKKPKPKTDNPPQQQTEKPPQ